MKTIKVYYSTYKKEILGVLEGLNQRAFVEVYNLNSRRDMAKVRKAMEDYGTKTLPLVVFEDENLDGVAAIWSEQKPANWRDEIEKILKEI